MSCAKILQINCFIFSSHAAQKVNGSYKNGTLTYHSDSLLNNDYWYVLESWIVCCFLFLQCYPCYCKCSNKSFSSMFESCAWFTTELVHHFLCMFQATFEPAFLPIGTEVSAKYRGAFCEAKVKKLVRSVKLKVSLHHCSGLHSWQ